MNKLIAFAKERLEELTESFKEKVDNDTYSNRVLIKIIDNLSVNVKNFHIRIEEPNVKPHFSLGITMQEIMIQNTDSDWNEVFIDRNVDKQQDVFKQLKMFNFSIYLNILDKNFLHKLERSDILLELSEMFSLDAPYAKDVDFFLKPSRLLISKPNCSDDSVQQLFFGN